MRLLGDLLIVSATLGACGGGGTGSAEDDVRGIIEEGARNPSSLCGHLTSEALKALGGEAKCRELARSSDNTDRDIEVGTIAVEGDRATANVKGKDGDQTLTFRKEDGEWRLGAE